MSLLRYRKSAHPVAIRAMQDIYNAEDSPDGGLVVIEMSQVEDGEFTARLGHR